MGFHNFFGEKIIFGGVVSDPVKIRGPGFLLDSLDSLDFHWILTGFSVVAKHMVEIILLAQTFFSR